MVQAGNVGSSEVIKCTETAIIPNHHCDLSGGNDMASMAIAYLGLIMMAKHTVQSLILLPMQPCCTSQHTSQAPELNHVLYMILCLHETI